MLASHPPTPPPRAPSPAPLFDSLQYFLAQQNAKPTFKSKTNGVPRERGLANGHGPEVTAKIGADLVKLLGPGTTLKSLDALVDGYTKVHQSFNGLLQYPFLDAMINTAAPESAEDEPNSNLRDLVASAQAEFTAYMNSDVTISRDLSTYASMVELLLVGLSAKEFSEAISDVVTDYAEATQKKSDDKKGVLSKLGDFTLQLKGSITTVTSSIENLTEKIATSESDLDNTSIVKELTNILSKVFDMAKSEADQEEQVASLLDISTNVIFGKFKQIFDNKANLKILIASLTKLKNNLKTLLPLLSSLYQSLPLTINASVKLSGTWDYVAVQLEAAADVDETPTKSQIDNIASAWRAVASNTDAFRQAVAGVPVKPKLLSAFTAEEINTPVYPKTQAQINIRKLVNKAGNTQASFASKVKTANRRSVRTRTAQIKRLRAMFALAEGEDDPDGTKFKEAFSPPGLSETLENLSGSVSGITQQFNNILQLQFLDSLKVRNPWFAGPIPTPQNLSIVSPLKRHSNFLDDKEEEEQIDLKSMVERYRAMYLELQNATIPVARDLATYAQAQALMIPVLVPDSIAKKNDIKVSEYTAMNREIVIEQRDAVNDLHQRYLVFGQVWQTAINNLQAAINEAETTMKNAIDQIQKTKEELKSKILWGVLGTLGALVLFAVGAFLMPAGMVAIGGGLGLITKSIGDLMQIGQLNSTLAQLESTIETSRKTADQLKILMPAMEAIQVSIVEVTDIWGKVNQKLSDIAADMGIWDRNPKLFSVFGPAVVVLWLDVCALVGRYSEILAGVK